MVGEAAGAIQIPCSRYLGYLLSAVVIWEDTSYPVEYAVSWTVLSVSRVLDGWSTVFVCLYLRVWNIAVQGPLITLTRSPGFWIQFPKDRWHLRNIWGVLEYPEHVCGVLWWDTRSMRDPSSSRPAAGGCLGYSWVSQRALEAHV